MTSSRRGTEKSMKRIEIRGGAVTDPCPDIKTGERFRRFRSRAGRRRRDRGRENRSGTIETATMLDDPIEGVNRVGRYRDDASEIPSTPTAMVRGYKNHDFGPKRGNSPHRGLGAGTETGGILEFDEPTLIRAVRRRRRSRTRARPKTPRHRRTRSDGTEDTPEGVTASVGRIFDVRGDGLK